MASGVNGRAFLLCVAFCFLAGPVVPARGQQEWTQRVLLLSPQETKALAVGGALTSVQGDLGVVLYNPAALETFRYPQRLRFCPVFNPVSVVLFTAGVGSRPAWRGKDAPERLALVGSVFPGLLVRWRALDVALSSGLDLTEGDFERQVKLGFGDFPQAHGHLAVARIRLANEVTVGASIFYAQAREASAVRRGVGASYGVLVQSHEGLRFGVSYVAFPAPAREVLRARDRLVSGTVNLGLSYTAFQRWLVALDVRNLSEETKRPLREFHFGTQLLVHRHLALRGGIYRDGDRDEAVISGGLALLDRNRFVSPDRFLRGQAFVVEYGLRVFPKERQIVQAFSLLLRL